MTEERKRELMLRFAVENGCEWPEDKELLLSATKVNVNFKENYLHTTCREYCHDAWVEVCTRTEYKDFIESLFKDAPEDATHVDILACKTSHLWSYRKVSDDLKYYFHPIFESWDLCDSSDKANIIPRPRKQKVERVEWMPDIGEECLVSNCGSDFEECTPKYLSSTYAIVEHSYGEQHYHRNNVKFRPLKTEAEKERDELYTKAIATIENDMLNYIGQAYDYRDAVEALINAKWRPQK